MELNADRTKRTLDKGGEDEVMDNSTTLTSNVLDFIESGKDEVPGSFYIKFSNC